MSFPRRQLGEAEKLKEEAKKSNEQKGMATQRGVDKLKKKKM